MSSPENELETLRRENERLRLLVSRDHRLLDIVLEQSPHGVIMCDANGKLILQNAAADRIWAGSAAAEDVAGWGRYRAFHLDGRPFEGGDWSMARCLTNREFVEAEEYHIQRFDDTHGWLIGSAAPLIDDDGRLLGAVSVFADITRLKEIETDNRRRALEIHDDVVQDASRAKLALDLGREEEAKEAIGAALKAARKVVADLLRDAGPDAVSPGGLRRTEGGAE